MVKKGEFLDWAAAKDSAGGYGTVIQCVIEVAQAVKDLVARVEQLEKKALAAKP